MSHHITVVPASTRIGRETIRVLLGSESKPCVRGIYRDTSKVPDNFNANPNFQTATGDIGVGDALDFSRSDAVFYIPPAIYDGPDQGEWATRSAENVKNSLRDAPNVKKLVLLSAIGSQYDHGIGIIRLNHISERILKDAAPEVIIVRPSWFQEEFASFLEMAQADPPIIHSWITPLDYKVPLVSRKDVGECCAKSLLSESTNPSPHFLKLFGPRFYSSIDLKNAVEEVTGKDVELRAIEKDHLAGHFAKQIPEEYLQDYVDLATAILPGGIIAGDLIYDNATFKGQVELVDTLRQLYTKPA
ncbi:hypothetical protein N7474_007122 [Penicillium riverlandense]|uniref:uncharacterized protein n=1 Tax=Penicillium riverlandense TaxID=1903569 RepID=UPI002546E1F9|nr:uncharacterized protein N7474_007122 [Penicillium riverlandense]KAJ5815345.1 hypothetical protein N7474_007122 [Penicillium riverlandense]